MTSTSITSTSNPRLNPANRLGFDYLARAQTFSPRPTPIIDIHTHLNGPRAVRLFQRAAQAYGIGLTYTMTPLPNVPPVQNVMGDSARFIAIPNWHAEDKATEFGKKFLDTITEFHQLGSRICKFWVAPRSIDIATELGDPDMLRLNSPTKIAAMKLASSLGMIFMVHVADPDTWFATKYSDASIYGSKRQQYEPFEELLDRFTQPWIAAHMGGWPEDLKFLTNLLDAHPNLYLDTSACKWMVRELSKHPSSEFHAFMQRFRGRILFGTDIVTTDEHLESSTDDEHEMMHKANSTDEAFDLYASRFWALRTLFEHDYEGESPIVDPDLHMVDPEKHSESAAPLLLGKALPDDLLQVVYHDAAHDLLEPLHSTS